MATNCVTNQIGVLPAFMYTNAADVGNTTGGAAQFFLKCDTKIFDTTNSFDGISTFTAPLTGIYSFSVTCNLSNILITMTRGIAGMEVAGTVYRFFEINPYNSLSSAGYLDYNATIICPMTKNDTAKTYIQIIGGADVVTVTGVAGAGYPAPTFSGYMISGI